MEGATYLDFQEGITRATQAGLLDGSVKFYLAGQMVPGEIHKIRTVTSSRKTNGSNKSDEEACVWALQSALVSLQNAAKKAGANAVIDIASVYKRDVYKDAQKYQCRAGMLIASVALRGELATVK
ncbi:excinuclease [Pseudomonas otitidis]|nr:excinuclease [Pseudomonas otitidis]MDH0338715.1 excinuclease [Pseudomonas otitidis]